MLSRRITYTISSTVSNTFAACAAAVCATRFSGVKSKDSSYEDDRWLEAELASSAEMTAEERYARQRDHELMKKILKRSREQAQAHVEEKVSDHKKEIDGIKEQMAALQAALEKAQGKK